MAAEFTDANFQTEVLGSAQPVLVDFWAQWCPPCRMLGPIVDKLSKDLAGTVKIGKMNADTSLDTVAKYGVQSLPTLLLFKNGEVVGQAIGFQPEPRLREFIRTHAGV